MKCNYFLTCLFGIVSCMLRGSFAREAIVGGIEVKKDNEFKYQVSIYNQDIGNLCGGGILDEYFILTAAHCTLGRDNKPLKMPLVIVAGVKNLVPSNIDNCTLGRIRKIYVPANYNPADEEKNGDISVLKLIHPLDMSKQNQLKALALPNNTKDAYIGKIGTIAGFGLDKKDNRTLRGNITNNFLRYANARILGPSKENYPAWSNFGKQISARTKSGTVCRGDRGSPLVVKGERGKLVVGILIARPVGTAKKEVGAIYTRVSRHLDFIKNAMNGTSTNMTRIYIVGQ